MVANLAGKSVRSQAETGVPADERCRIVGCLLASDRAARPSGGTPIKLGPDGDTHQFGKPQRGRPSRRGHPPLERIPAPATRDRVLAEYWTAIDCRRSLAEARSGAAEIGDAN